MHKYSYFSADGKFWVSIASMVTAAWAAFNSWQSRRIANRALDISERQEERRLPRLGVYLTNGYRRFLPEQQVFGFLVSISNPTDINNSIAQAELQLTCLLGTTMSTFRVPHRADLTRVFYRTEAQAANVFPSPVRIEAHQTLAGWLLFSVDQSLLKNKTVDSHRIILEDSHGLITETESLMVRDWADED